MYKDIEIKKYESFFKEMAFSKSQIESKIIDSNVNRLEHLILIFLLKKDRANKHWQTEVASWILQIARMKWANNHKYLSEKEYFTNLWVKPFENKDNYHIIDETIYDLIFEGYDIPDNWGDYKKTLVNKIKDFYMQISSLLSKGRISKEVLYTMLGDFRKLNLKIIVKNVLIS